MPKRRDTGRRTPPRPDQTAKPPEQAEVERAIQKIVERLKPTRTKPDAPAPKKKPERKAGPPGRLSLVWDRDGQEG